MKISTRGRYALRVLIDLAEHDNGAFIPLKDVAARQGISQKYLEGIIGELTKSGFLEGMHGKGGGYKLCKNPEDITVGDILRSTEGDLAPITCLEKTAAPCFRAAECRTIKMWKDFYKTINDFFDGIVLSDLVNNGSSVDNYVI